MCVVNKNKKINRSYKFYNSKGFYFASLAVIDWLDVFVKKKFYKNIVIGNLVFCITYLLLNFAGKFNNHTKGDLCRSSVMSEENI